MTIIMFIDQAAWIAVRLIGLLQALIGELVTMFYQPNPCKTDEYEAFNILMSLTFGGWMLFHSHKPADLPSIMSERYLRVGRFVLAVFIISTVTSIVRSIL